jgi:hypothetical protein
MMSIFDQWSDFVVKSLEVESKLAGLLLKHGGELGDAREALIADVLSRILPSAYDIGSGEIIDSYGGRSRQIDIVISRRDAPSLLLPGGTRLYLVESVVATIEVKSLVYEEGLTEALENCASVADLHCNVTTESYEKMATRADVTRVAEGFVFDDGLEAARFTILGNPISYIFGFGGYKDFVNFGTAIGKWASGRIEKDSFGMRHVPAVITADGLVAIRNAPPYHMSPEGPGEEKALCLIGTEPTPLRIFITHLLSTLNSKMAPDEHGLMPNPSSYLAQGLPFDFQRGLFAVPPGRWLVKYPFDLNAGPTIGQVNVVNDGSQQMNVLKRSGTNKRVKEIREE